MATMIAWFSASVIIAAIRQYAEKRSWVTLRNKDVENLEKLVEEIQSRGWEGFVNSMQQEPAADVQTHEVYKLPGIHKYRL